MTFVLCCADIPPVTHGTVKSTSPAGRFVANPGGSLPHFLLLPSQLSAVDDLAG